MGKAYCGGLSHSFGKVDFKSNHCEYRSGGKGQGVVYCPKGTQVTGCTSRAHRSQVRPIDSSLVYGKKHAGYQGCQDNSGHVHEICCH